MGRDLWERAGDPEFEPRLGQKSRLEMTLLYQGHVAKWMNAPVSDTYTPRERERDACKLPLCATGSLFLSSFSIASKMSLLLGNTFVETTRFSSISRVVSQSVEYFGETLHFSED